MMLAVGVALGTWVLAAVDRLLGRRSHAPGAARASRFAMRIPDEPADQPRSADAQSATPTTSA